MAIAALTCAALAAGCGSDRHKGAGRAHDSDKGFSIVPPSGWTKGEAMMGAFMVHYGPKEGDFAVNLNVVVQPHDGSAVQDFPRQIKPFLAKLMTDYEDAGDGFVQIDGRKCYHASSKFRMGVARLRNLQYFITSSNGKQVFTLTFTSPVDSFDRHRPVFEQCALTARTD